MKVQTFANRMETVRAAVQNGAEEIRFSYLFPSESIAEALDYCRVRGFKTVWDITGMFADKTLAVCAEGLFKWASAGLSAVAFSDIGVGRMAAMVCSRLERHYAGGARTQDDILYAQSQGYSRVVLARDITALELERLRRTDGIELQICGLSPGCPSVSGYDCYLGNIDNNRPEGCRKTCRGRYGFGSKADGTPLWYKDYCLLAHTGGMREIDVFGVTPEDGEPETAALLTQLAFRSIDGETPGKPELAIVEEAVKSPGFSDAVYTGEGSPQNHKNPSVQSVPAQKLLSLAKESYSGGVERDCVPVRFFCHIKQGEKVRLAADDYQGHTVYVSGTQPSPAGKEGILREAEANTQLYKTAGTPYRCVEAKTKIEGHVQYPLQSLQELRRDVLKKLSVERSVPPDREVSKFRSGVRFLPRKDEPVINIRLAHMRQMSDELLSFKPHMLFLPIDEILSSREKLQAIARAGVIPAAVLPRLLQGNTAELLEKILELGVRHVSVHRPEHSLLPLSKDFVVHGEELAANSQTIKAAKNAGFVSVGLSSSLSLADIKLISHGLDTELLMYGRRPVLLTSGCLLKRHHGICGCENSHYLTDEQGVQMPLAADTGHTNMIYHPQKLWLVKEKQQFARLGLWAYRLSFTTEHARECIQVTERYSAEGKYEPNQCSTGFYFISEK